MSTVRGIGFDLDHTLAIDNRLERVALLRVLEIVLDEGGRTIGTLGDEIDGIDELLLRQRSGAFTIDDAVQRFVAEHGVEPADRYADLFRRTAVEMVDEFVVPLPGVRPTLDALCERGIAVAMLSNGWNPLQTRKAERAGFRGPILVSGETGERKPAPKAFELLLHALGSSPAQTWYVGDDPQIDVAGAQAVGIQGVWINWEGKSYPAHLPPPGHTIVAFPELLALLPSPVRVT